MCLALVSCAGQSRSAPKITDARIGEPVAANGALYFTVLGYGSDDRLVSVTTSISTRTKLAVTTIDADGLEGMDYVDSMDLPRDGELVLEPAGRHVMLIDVDPVKAGETVQVTARWEKAGEILFDALVVEVTEVGGTHHSG